MTTGPQDVIDEASHTSTEDGLLRAPLVEHIRELRTRLIRSLVVVVVMVAGAWFFHEEFFDWLMAPYTRSMQEKFPDIPHYIEYRSLTEPLIVYFKASGVVGVIAATPYVLFEIWGFVVPGLYKSERQMAGSFLVATLFFFFGGVLFCRYFVMDPAVSMLLNIGATNTSASIMMQEYFSFTSRMLLVFGLLFELPVVISFLSFLGLVTHHTLLKYWRHATVVMFIVGAILTPPDPLTQALLSIPLVMLYFVSVGVSWMFTMRREAKLKRMAE